MTVRRTVISAIFLCLAASWLPGTSVLAMTRREAREIIDVRGSDPLSGIWQLGGDGAVIAIVPERSTTARFEIYLLDSPDMSVIPGNQIGTAVATGQPGRYDVSLDGTQNIVRKKRRFIFTIDDTGHLKINPYKQGKKVALWRLIPYMFRVSVSDVDTRPSTVDGAIKIYPPSPGQTPTLL